MKVLKKGTITLNKDGTTLFYGWQFKMEHPLEALTLPAQLQELSQRILASKDEYWGKTFPHAYGRVPRGPTSRAKDAQTRCANVAPKRIKKEQRGTRGHSASRGSSR